MLSEQGIAVKRQLEEFKQLKRKINNLKTQLQETIEIGAFPNKADYNISFTSGGNSISAQERCLLKIEELQEKILKTIEIALERESEFLKSIEELDLLSYNLLVERYMHGKPLHKLVRDFNYDKRHLYRIYNKAFEKLSEKSNR